jgi:hypothetical protein
MNMLKIGGYLNILIAIGHIIGLIWADQVFALFGISEPMNRLAEIHFSLPYLLTFFVSLVFLIFGLYGLSAEGELRRLPLLKPALFVIAGLYIVRGLGELIYETTRSTHSTAEITYSLIALALGLLYLIGGVKKWKPAMSKVS